jgi:arsenite methyltransferase
MGTTKAANAMGEGEGIQQAVKERYARLVSTPGGGSCCSSSCCGGQAEAAAGTAQSIGYTAEELAHLPAEAVARSFGCGNPLAFAQVEEGQTVLDIGSGAGIDCFLAAGRVGPAGRVIGVDMTPEMLEKARANARAGGYRNVEFRLGGAENLPAEEGSVDWVISNCVINLSPDKPAVFREIARVLKPGGRFSISDIVLGQELPDWLARNVMAWTGCIAGAIRETDYVEGLEAAGLRDVRVTSRTVYDLAQYRPLIEDDLARLPAAEVESVLASLRENIWSAKIEGRKGRTGATEPAFCQPPAGERESPGAGRPAATRSSGAGGRRG